MNSHVLKFVPILAYLSYGTSVFVFTVDVCCTCILVLSNDGVNIKIIAMEGLKPWVKMIFTSKWSVLDGDMLSVCPYSKKATVTLHKFATTNWILMILNKNSPVFLFCVIAYIYIYMYMCFLKIFLRMLVYNDRLYILSCMTYHHFWQLTFVLIIFYSPSVMYTGHICNKTCEVVFSSTVCCLYK